MRLSRTYNEDEFRVPFPLEILIGQTPVSAQARNPKAKDAWKTIVGTHAKDKISKTREWYDLDGRPLMVTIYYFPPSKMAGDIDNIVNPILDGMNNIAYPDDRHIEKVVVQKFEPGIPWLFPSPSLPLEVAINMEKPALYIRVEDSLSWREAS